MSNPSWKEQLTLTITDTDVCGRDAKFTLTAEATADLFTAAAKDVARKAQIPGFRVGKAPLSMVKNRYKNYVDEEAGRLLQLAAYDLLSKKADEMDIISYSKLQPEGTLEEGKEFSLKCEFEIAPEFELPDYNGLGEVADSEDAAKIEADLIERAKAQYSSFVPITDAAKEGDMLHVSYESDFALPEDASDSLKRAVKNDSAWVYLIGQEMIPGVNAALIGATVGGEYTFTADFPACVTVVGDFDELEAVAVIAPPVHGMVVYLGDDQRRQVDIRAILVGTDVVVQPVDALLYPSLHVVDIRGVLRHLVPALVVAGDGFTNQCVNLVDACADDIVVQGLSGLCKLKPTLGKIATEQVGVEQVFPELGTVVVGVIKLPHIVLATAAESIVSVGEVVVPHRTRTQLAAAVFVEEGAVGVSTLEANSPMSMKSMKEGMSMTDGIPVVIEVLWLLATEARLVNTLLM